MLRRLFCTILIFGLLVLIPECVVHPVRAAASLSILPTDSGYLNDNGLYCVVGEVENTGNTTMTDAYVNATFYDSTGVSVAEISQPIMLSTILPGRVSPFEIVLYSNAESQKVHNYTLRIVKSATTSNGQIGLSILSNISALDSNGFHINGTIKNVGAQNISFTQVIATFYNQNGHAIAAVFVNSSPNLLSVNQTGQFEILLNTSEASQVNHYALEAEAYDSSLNPDYELIPEFQPTTFVCTLLILTAALISAARRFGKGNLRKPANQLA